MQNPQPMTTREQSPPGGAAPPWPPGNHPLEIAARHGIGPLSPLGRNVWHGHARPCVSCGQLVRREALYCEHCGQDLSPAMLEKMRAVAGPWYVFEHVRPFPGVNLERIVRQIRRGVITETSIVRGPSTDFQWRFAGETPGLCRFFGRCWSCHEQVSWSDVQCPLCAVHLAFEQPRAQGAANPPRSSAPATRPPGTASSARTTTNVTARRRFDAGPFAGGQASEELRHLSAAIEQATLHPHGPVWDEPPRVAGIRATWAALIVMALAVAAFLWLTWSRTAMTAPPPSPPGMVAPAR